MVLGADVIAACLQLNIDEVFNSLVLPACSYALMGKAGVILIACVLFMAVTSGGAGEMLAVSSLFTFDVWREYIRPQVTCCSPQTIRDEPMQCASVCVEATEQSLTTVRQPQLDKGWRFQGLIPSVPCINAPDGMTLPCIVIHE